MQMAWNFNYWIVNVFPIDYFQQYMGWAGYGELEYSVFIALV